MKRNRRHSFIAAALTLLMLWVFIPQAQATMSTSSYSTQYMNSTYYTKLKNVTITGNQRDDIVNIALSQVGYHEGNNNSELGGNNTNGSNNYTEYNYWYYSGTLNGGDAAPWCAVFVSWCARQAGIGTDIINNSAYSSWTSDYFNVTSYARDEYTPQKGDLFFRNNDHVGIVEGVDSNYVYTIEGNSSNCVARRTYSRTSSSITKYGVPKYNSNYTPTPTQNNNPYSEPPYGTELGTWINYSSEYVRWLQWELNYLGYNCDTVDGWYGNNTKSAVESFQRTHGLTADGIFGPITHNAIKSAHKDKEDGEQTSIPTGYYTVYASGIYMRANHSSSANALATIPNGAILYVKSCYNGWGKITYSGQDGWILLSNCIFDGSINRYYAAITPGDTLNLRANHNANSSTAILARVPDGALLHVDYFYNGWGRTTYNGKTGWVNLCYCRYNGSMDRYYTVNISATTLNVRADHNSSSAVIDSLPNGAILYVKYFYNGWGKITYNGQDGWVHLSNCKYNSSIDRTYTVITPDDTLNLRADHNSNSSTEILDFVPDGELLHVDYFYNGWGRTKYNGKTGWVNLCYCKHNSGMSRYYTVDISGSTLNMRADHSSSSAVIDNIPNGATLLVKFFCNGWGKVTYKGQDGWIHLSNCKFNSNIDRTYTVFVTGGSLNLRADHNTNSSTAILDRVPDGTLLHVDYFYNGWGRTTYNGKTGWVNLCYCKYNSGINRSYTVIANPSLSLRDNPSATNTNILTTIPRGTVISVTFFKNGWGKTTYNGKTGWVSLDLCSYNP